MNYYILFILGLGIGSFINVVTLRYREEGFVFGKHIVYGRSHCSSCKRVLSWYELVPLLSFIILLGKCRTCKSKLSFQYPIVELICGAFISTIPYYFFKYHNDYFINTSSEWLILFSVLWILVFLGLIIIGVIDYRKYIVPDELVLSTALLGIIWIIFLAVTNNFGFLKGSFLGEYASIFGLRAGSVTSDLAGYNLVFGLIVNHLVGFVLGLVLVGIIFFSTKGAAIGFGDVKLFGALGILFGYPDVILIFFLSFISGAIFSLPLLVRKLKGMKDYVPFAPFIIFASTLVFYFGNDIIRIYFHFFDNLLIRF